uniref:Late secretory pathway protein AVL9 homolog n=1 Tax=Schistocephalus solidus TaxID=70667 RepID=A0A0X3Q8Y2_SCHSO
MSCVCGLFVVGFHHKKGAEVEFSYPEPSYASELPSQWSCIPSIALPDGAHNFKKDSVFFTLPSLLSKSESLFGVACYRQIDAKDFSCRTAESTRNSIQKSVVVLCRAPLFGILVDRVDLLTDRFLAASSIQEGRTYLREGFHDIEQVLDAVLHDSVKYESALYCSLSAVSFVRAYQRDALVLLKLLLLERRILFSSDIAVNCLSIWLLTLVSLLPGTLAGGLSLCTVVDESWTRDRSCWPMAAYRALSARQEGVKKRESVEEDRTSIASHTEEPVETGIDTLAPNPIQPQKTGFWSTFTKTASAFSARVQAAVAGQTAGTVSGMPMSSNGVVASARSEKTGRDNNNNNNNNNNSASQPRTEVDPPPPTPPPDPWAGLPPLDDGGVFDSPLPTDDWGLPLSLFCRSYLLLPYVPLSRLDLLLSLSDAADEDTRQVQPSPVGHRVRGFLAGTTNPLLCQHNTLAEVVVRTLPLPPDASTSLPPPLLVADDALEPPEPETEQPNIAGELQEKSRPPHAATQSQPSQPTRSTGVFSKLLNRPQSAIRLSPPSDDTACRLRAMPASLHRAAQLSRPDRSFIDYLFQTIELWYAANQYRLVQQQQQQQPSSQEDKDGASSTGASVQPYTYCAPHPTPMEANVIGKEDSPQAPLQQQSDLNAAEVNASSQFSKVDALLQSYSTVLQRFPALADLEAWTRTQFATYVKSLLLTAEGRLNAFADFNSTYVTCFRATHCFLVWRNQYVPTLVAHSELHEPDKSVGLNLDEPADDTVSDTKSLGASSLSEQPSFSAPSPWVHPGRSHPSTEVSDHLVNNLKQFGNLAAGHGRRVMNQCVNGLLRLSTFPLGAANTQHNK